MLYLTGYGLTLDDLKQFRQLRQSRTPGPPRGRSTLPGIEVTTGPLGQGFANGVGMGVAERCLRAGFGPELVDHHTFVICSDGDLMEGISHEAASLAGHLGLGRLVYVYDDNHITIDGPTELALNDDAASASRPTAGTSSDLGEVANDIDALEAACAGPWPSRTSPSLLILRSHIGWPSPHKTDTPRPTASPLGADEVRATKEILGPAARRDVLGARRGARLLPRRPSPGARPQRGRWEQRLRRLRPATATPWDACLGEPGPCPAGRPSCPTWKAGRQARHPAGPQRAASTPSSTTSPAWSPAAPT